jgi:hypothetical protein
VEAYSHAFLTSALDGGEWSASRLGLFTPRERDSGTHWIGGWVGPTNFTLGKDGEGVDGIYLAQDKEQWQALVNTVMSLWVPYKAGGGNLLTS